MTDEIMEGQMSLFDLDIWSGKTSKVPLVRAVQGERISELSLKKPRGSQTKMPLFLDLRKESGNRQDASWETDGVSLGAYMTASGGEFHSADSAYVYSLTLAGTQQERYCLNCSEKPLTKIPSKLSWILEQNPDPKYNLSQKACSGILRRAENRGKTLPPMLESALRRQAGVSMDGMFNQSISSQKTESQNPCMPESAEGVVENPMLCSQEQLVSKKEPESQGGGKGILIQNERTGALSTLNNQSVVYGISSYDSNAMKSANPNSGIYKAETSRTLDLNGGSPACNQGGMAVVCLEGNGSRPSHQGDGWHEGDPMYTLNSTEHHAIAIENHPADSRVKISEDGMVQTLSSRMGTGGGNVPMVVEGINGEISGTLDASYYKGCGERQGVEREVVCVGNGQLAAKYDFCIDEEKVGAQTAKGPGAVCQSVVRRLTPLECERLQGYPDGWTDIGDWVDSRGKTHNGDADSPRYKALGNSIALPFWQWMAGRMVSNLGERPTMASLFDGIGGFPLVFSRCGCEPIWASEIEEFPIAVTKKRFPEQKED